MLTETLKRMWNVGRADLPLPLKKRGGERKLPVSEINPMTATDCGPTCREYIRFASGNLGGLKRLNTRTMSIVSSQSDSWS